MKRDLRITPPPRVSREIERCQAEIFAVLYSEQLLDVRLFQQGRIIFLFTIFDRIAYPISPPFIVPMVMTAMQSKPVSAGTFREDVTPFILSVGFAKKCIGKILRQVLKLAFLNFHFGKYFFSSLFTKLFICLKCALQSFRVHELERPERQGKKA